MKEIDYAGYRDLMDGNSQFMLDLYLEKCEPCRELLPILEVLESSLDFPIYKMDILKNRRIYHELGLQKSPTVIHFAAGAEVGRVVLKQEPAEYLKLAEML